MIRHRVLLGGVVLAWVWAAAPVQAQEAASGNGLPSGEGRRTVATLCSSCHSLKLVRQQGMSRHRWDQTLVWMVEKQGMPALPEAERDVVLDYLAEHFGAQRETSQQPATGMRMQPLMPAR